MTTNDRYPEDAQGTEHTVPEENNEKAYSLSGAADKQNSNERIETNEELFAGFWMRFWAYLTDLIILFSLNGILLSPFYFTGEGEIWGFITLYAVFNAVITYGYFALMTKFYGQTLGKMIFGLRVVRVNREKLKWSDIIFREIVLRFAYRSLVITNLAYIVVAFTPQKAGIHDMIADTRVIHTRK
ncbi:RDD family protein [Marinococcus halotolerans]|uniref:RDD family protein n=1 Tax=Marinococcus halotolerans TaxID=301092 RepID=UPI0003B66B5C|nr:RDD family protein [Marinococcus halotolerans]